jgi:hypothetical protein
MAGLSAFFCLLGMLTYVKARQVKGSGWALPTVLYACSFLVLWPLGLASKENAVLFPIYLFLTELVFLRFRNPETNEKSFSLIFLYGIFLIIPGFILASYFLFYNPDWILNGYKNRDFSIGERLFTESRVLLFYIGQTFFPTNSSLGFFHDDFSISRSVLSPWTTIVAIVTLFSLVLTAFLSLKKYPVLAFGILFFLIAHSLESTIFALELVHEHRNYLAIFSILFALAYYFVAGSDRYLSLRVILAVFLVVFFGTTTLTRAAVWGEPAVHAITEVTNHPLSPRAHYGLGKQYAIYANSLTESSQKTEALDTAVKYFQKSASLSSSYTDGLFGLLMIEALEGREMTTYYHRSLLYRLSSTPFSNNNYNYLHAVLSCLESGDCDIPSMKLDEIIDASIANPSFRGQCGTSVLKRYREYKDEFRSE